MRFLTVTAVFIAALNIGQSENPSYKFDCRKFVNICKNNGTCSNDPACTCTSGYNAYDCSNEIAGSVECSEEQAVQYSCQNGGTCYKTESDPFARCVCPYGYFGDKCEKKLAEITCQGEIASYILSFPSEFDGRVVLVDRDYNSLVDQCPFVKTTDEFKTTYNLTVDITDDDSQQANPCKMSNLQIFEETKRTFQAFVYVYYTKYLDTNVDEFFRMNCTHNTENGEVSIDIQNVDLNKEELNENQEETQFGPFELAFIDEAKTPIDSGTTIAVGTKVSLDLYLRENSGYTKVFFHTCTANNTLKDDDERKLQFLYKGCSTLEGIIVSAKQTPITKEVDSDGTPVTINGMSVSFNVFKFSGTDQIGIKCLARACKDGDTKCEIPTNCTDIMKETPAAPANGGQETENENNGTRKKRASEDEENEQTITKVLKVVGSKQDKTNISTETETEEYVDPVEECLSKIEITAVIAVLSACLCVVLIVCFVLACIILQRRGKHISSYDRPELQPKQERFQIPRAHVNDSYEIM